MVFSNCIFFICHSVPLPLKHIMVSDWFFGYEGSLTEPPCTEFLEWRIIDKPALISEQQLVQMKRILFNHVDKDCERTSVHSEEYGVARPLQSYSGRLVHRCMCRDFLGDETRKEYGENRCRWVDREKFGFDPDQYSSDWYEKTVRLKGRLIDTSYYIICMFFF